MVSVNLVRVSLWALDMDQTLRNQQTELLRSLHEGRSPPSDAHFARCFDVLAGAAFSIIAADEWQFQDRSIRTWSEWHEKVRIPLIDMIRTSGTTLGASFSPGGWANWVSGYYFNSAAQRIVSVGERLTKIFAALDLRCCPDAPRLCSHDQEIVDALRHEKEVRVGQLTSICRLHLLHLNTKHFSDRPLVGIDEYLRVAAISNKDHVVSDKNYFAALRWDVNRLKHSPPGPGRLPQVDSTRRTPRKWSDLPDREKFDYLQRSFKCVCGYYSDLYRAHAGSTRRPPS